MINRRTWLQAAALGWPAVAWARRKGRTAMDQGVNTTTYPIYQVGGGSYGELGYAIGRQARERIGAAFAARAKWVDELVAYAMADRGPRYDAYLNAVRDELPRLEDEMKGIALGCGIAFERLFAVAINPELSTLMKTATYHQDCTSVAVAGAGKLWIGHNEDGSCSYRDDMYLLEIAWPGGGKALALSYPGYWPGNGPMVNSHGIVQTVNYLGAQAVRPGLPRYAIDRAIMEAKDLDEAVALACHPRRAYSQHHLLGSCSERKLVTVETSIENYSVLPVAGVYPHANHFVHPTMEATPQLTGYKSSSLPRQLAAEEWAAAHPDPAALAPDDLLGLLTSHGHAPHPVCRHPDSAASGCTLAGVIITLESKRLRIWDGPPCQAQGRELAWPA